MLFDHVVCKKVKIILEETMKSQRESEGLEGVKV